MRGFKAGFGSMIAAATLAAGLLGGPGSAQAAPFWTTPTIQGYGKMHYLPHAAFKPDPRATYKIVFALTMGAPKPTDVDMALDHVARAVNLYAAAGVPLSHMKFVAIVYGPATPIVLDDAHYKAAYGVPNPNLDLIAKLRKAGVVITVCGQAVAEHHFQYAWIDHRVSVALSALTTVTVLQHDGYALSQM